jgi:hypothetical protein
MAHTADITKMQEFPDFPDLGEETIEDSDPIHILGDDTEEEKPAGDETPDEDKPLIPGQKAEEGAEGEGKEEEKPDAQTSEAKAAAELKTKAEAYDNLLLALSRNPSGQVAQLFGALTQAQQQEVLRALGVAPAAPPKPGSDEEGWKDNELTAPERLVKQHREVIQTLPQFQQNVGTAFQEVVGMHQQLQYENAVLAAQVRALLQANDLQLPSIDAKDVNALMQQGKTMQQAVAELSATKFIPVVTVTKKKKVVETPNTPMNGVTGSQNVGVHVKAGTDLVDIMRAIQKNGKG